MPSGSSKTTSKRSSSKNAEIEEMASAVLGNESSFSRALAQEELENIDDTEVMSKENSKRPKKSKTYYGDSPIKVPPSRSKSAPKLTPPEDGNYDTLFKKSKAKVATKRKATSIGKNKEILLSTDSDAENGTKSSKMKSTTTITRLSPLKGSPNSLRGGRVHTGDPCCECTVFINFAQMGSNGGLQKRHSHYCKGGCGLPIHGMCGVAESEDNQMNRVCTKCQSISSSVSKTALVKTKSNTVTKKRKPSMDEEVVDVTNDAPKEGKQKESTRRCENWIW